MHLMLETLIREYSLGGVRYVHVYRKTLAQAFHFSPAFIGHIVGDLAFAFKGERLEDPGDGSTNQAELRGTKAAGGPCGRT